jgi:hypothetical protein
MLESIKAYDILIKSLNENIRSLKAHPKILDKEEHKYLYPVYEKAMYIAISASDLIIGLKYLDVSNAIKNRKKQTIFLEMLHTHRMSLLIIRKKLLVKKYLQ